MRYLFGFICVLALGVMGCGETAGTGGSGGAGGVGGVGGVGGGGTSTAPLTVILDTLEDQAPVEGARLCEIDTDNCVLTDADGTATLMLPIDRETAYTRDKEGYAPWLTPVLLSEGGALQRWVVPTDERIANDHERVGSPYPMSGTGSIAVGISSAFAGATFELLDATGVPWYMDEDFDWRPDLTATTSSEIGGFTEVTPGVVQFKLGGTADPCAATNVVAWPGNEPNSFRAPVREGHVTGPWVDCPQP
jgi:hypothetical protein